MSEPGFTMQPTVAQSPGGDSDPCTSRQALDAFIALHDVLLDDTGKTSLCAAITYHAPFGTIALPADVTVHAAGDWAGRISLQQSKLLTPDRYLMHFLPQWADYSCPQGAQSLLVAGRSAWMGGHYKVWINPLL